MREAVWKLLVPEERGTRRTEFFLHELSTQRWRWEVESCTPAQSKSFGRCNAESYLYCQLAQYLYGNHLCFLL